MAEYKLYNLEDPDTGQKEPQISPKEEFDIIKQKVPTNRIENPRTGQEGSAESVVKEGDMNPGDGRNVAMEVAKCLRDALREHGDEMKAVFLSDSTNEGATIKIQYMPDEQGQADEDEFTFRWGDGVLKLDNVANPVELCQLQKQSGTVNIQKDLVKANLLKFLQSHDDVEGGEDSQAADPNALPDGPVAEEQLWESEECQQAFCDAVDMYRKAKDKESIKNLFRAARPYQKGNTIQEKLKGAVDWYNIYTQKPPKNTKEQVFLEDSDVDTQNILQSVGSSLSELRRLQETGKVDSSSIKKAVFHLKEAFNLLQELENISEDNKQSDWDYGLSWDDLDIKEQEESNAPSVIVALQKLSEGLDTLKKYINRTEDIHLGAYFRPLDRAYDSLFEFCKRKGLSNYDDDLNEFMDLNDPIANGEPDNYGGGDPRDFDNDERNREWEDYDDEPVVHEGDEWGPEVGDTVDYEGGHYRLYGYCGYEVVLQNVDDERDFKIVKPEEAGFKSPEKDLKETNWVDPDDLPDDNDELQGV
jgi:hypothetical protein